MISPIRWAVGCLVVALMAAGCTSTSAAPLEDRLAAIAAEVDAEKAFSASGMLDEDGAWYQVGLGLDGPDGAALYYQRDGGELERVAVDAGERIGLDYSTVSEERVRGLLAGVDCDGSKSWRVTPTLSEANIEIASCADGSDPAATLGGEPVATGPGLLDEPGLRALWAEAVTALGTETASRVMLSEDRQRLYVAILRGGCRVGRGALFTRQLVDGAETPIRVDCLDAAQYRRENPGFDEGGVSIDDLVACLSETREGGVSVTAGGCG